MEIVLHFVCIPEWQVSFMTLIHLNPDHKPKREFFYLFLET